MTYEFVSCSRTRFSRPSSPMRIEASSSKFTLPGFCGRCSSRSICLRLRSMNFRHSGAVMVSKFSEKRSTVDALIKPSIGVRESGSSHSSDHAGANRFRQANFPPAVLLISCAGIIPDCAFGTIPMAAVGTVSCPGMITGFYIADVVTTRRGCGVPTSGLWQTSYVQGWCEMALFSTTSRDSYCNDFCLGLRRGDKSERITTLNFWLPPAASFPTFSSRLAEQE